MASREGKRKENKLKLKYYRQQCTSKQTMISDSSPLQSINQDTAAIGLPFGKVSKVVTLTGLHSSNSTSVNLVCHHVCRLRIDVQR